MITYIMIKDGKEPEVPKSQIEHLQRAGFKIKGIMEDGIFTPVDKMKPESKKSDKSRADKEPQADKEAAESKNTAKALEAIDGIGGDMALALFNAGFMTIQSVFNGENKELVKIPGIGNGNVGKIKANAEKCLQ